MTLKTVAIVLIGAVITLVVFASVENKVNSTSNSTTTDTTSTDSSSSTSTSKYTVSISGEVNKSGTYYIEKGGTLGDLITAANGVTSNADDRAYNLEYVLKNNQSFYIAPVNTDNDVCGLVPITKVNVNTASETELANVNALSSSSKIPSNIVTYRNTNGNFERIEDLKNVSLIGSATFEKLKNYVTIKWAFSYHF